MAATRTWQVLGRLYADNERISDSIRAYELSLELLERLCPRHGGSAQFAEYWSLSDTAMKRLSNQE